MSPIKVNNNNHYFSKHDIIDPPYWREDIPSPDAALQKMFKNSLKAIEEHQRKTANYPLDPQCVIPVIHPHSCPLPIPLKFKATYCELQGPRETMEDAYFMKELPQGYLAGVFDGHGGASASALASKRFSELFENHLSKSANHVHYALEKTMEELHQIISVATEDGTTAVVCYIEQKTNFVYTATLGDSEAHIYRLEGKTMHSIPASCVRDWTSAKDARRFAEAKETPKYEQMLIKLANTAMAKDFARFKGLNVSRALGDRAFNYENGRRAVIQKPKITVHQLLPGDILNLACDGLKDYVSEKATATKIHMVKQDPDFMPMISTQIAADAAWYRSDDNVTVVTIQVLEALDQ